MRGIKKNEGGDISDSAASSCISSYSVAGVGVSNPGAYTTHNATE